MRLWRSVACSSSCPPCRKVVVPSTLPRNLRILQCKKADPGPRARGPLGAGHPNTLRISVLNTDDVGATRGPLRAGPRTQAVQGPRPRRLVRYALDSDLTRGEAYANVGSAAGADRRRPRRGPRRYSTRPGIRERLTGR